MKADLLARYTDTLAKAAEKLWILNILPEERPELDRDSFILGAMIALVEYQAHEIKSGRDAS